MSPASSEAGTVQADGDSTAEIQRRPVEGGVAGFIWLNRPGQLNAIDSAMVGDLDRALRELDADPAVRAIFITGRGRAFSAGGDLKSYLDLQRDPVEFPRFLDALHATFSMIKLLSTPVVALVNGITAAGGLELLLSCDFAYAARSARIGDAHLTYGQMGGGGVLTLLPRMIGPARARELILSADFLTAHQAAEWQLVNRVVDDDELIPTALRLAASLASRSPNAVAGAKYVMNAGWADGTMVEATLRLERERTARYCLTFPDSLEGLTAFAQRHQEGSP